MKKEIYICHDFNLLFLIFTLISSIFLFDSCASSAELKVAEFKFNYEGNEFLLRSAYCANNPRSCNQIISKNFIATDLNQDRVIDEITKGDKTLLEAQKIYDYSLAELEKQGKVSQIDIKSNLYSTTDNNFTFEISSFSRPNKTYFNEFTIKEKIKFFEYKITVFIDNGADGILDKTLKGDFNIVDAQTKYKFVMNKALIDNQMKRINGFILVE